MYLFGTHTWLACGERRIDTWSALLTMMKERSRCRSHGDGVGGGIELIPLYLSAVHFEGASEVSVALVGHFVDGG